MVDVMKELGEESNLTEDIYTLVEIRGETKQKVSAALKVAKLL